MSILLGLNTGVRALMTQQQALNTTAHNIANANTPGYSRQDVMLHTTEPFTFPSMNRSALAGQVGTGVTIDQVRRMRDTFFDVQYRQQNQGLGYWDTVSQGIHDIEDVYNEPSDQGLGQQLSQFFNQWRDLVNDPRNAATRLTLKEQSLDLTSFIRRSYSELVQQQHHLDDIVVQRVDQVNSLADQISALNDQIGKVLAVGDTPNDLRDRRDLLLDDLSKIARITAFENDRGEEMVNLGGVQLVGDNFTNKINTVVNGGVHVPQWNSDGSTVNFTGGELKGLLDLRDVNIPGQIAALNTLAKALLDDVNAQHQLGHTLNDTTNNSLGASTGLDFFTAVAGNEAQTIDVSTDIQTDVNNIAAASNANAPGDSANADAIAGLQFSLVLGETAPLAADGTATIEDYYRGLISQLGSQGEQAKNQFDNQNLLVQHIETARQSVSGVSLDEEATKQIEYQRGFEAAARLVSTFDSMLDTIINHMLI